MKYTLHVTSLLTKIIDFSTKGSVNHTIKCCGKTVPVYIQDSRHTYGPFISFSFSYVMLTLFSVFKTEGFQSVFPLVLKVFVLKNKL